MFAEEQRPGVETPGYFQASFGRKSSFEGPLVSQHLKETFGAAQFPMSRNNGETWGIPLFSS